MCFVRTCGHASILARGWNPTCVHGNDMFHASAELKGSENTVIHAEGCFGHSICRAIFCCDRTRVMAQPDSRLIVVMR